MKKHFLIGLIAALLMLVFALAIVNEAQAAQVTFLRAGNGNDVTNTTTLPVPFPSPIASGNLILMQIAIRNLTITVTTPVGWTLLYGPDATASDVRQWIFYKIADGSETGNLNVTVGSGNILKMGRMYLFNNTDTSNFTEGGGFGTGTGNTISAQSVTTTGVERLAVSFVFVSDDNALDPFTGESGGDWTEALAEYTTTSGADGAMGLQIATMASAGTISGGTDTMGASDEWGVRAFALKPVPVVGPPTKLGFYVQPSNTTVGATISPAVQVEIQDASGNRVTTATDSVTIAKGPGSPAGTLGGTLTVSAVAGVATFSTLTIDTAGSNFTLRATSGILTLADSTTFNITSPPPTKLAFLQQPYTTAVNAVITPAVTVEIQDASGNRVTTATNSVTIAKNPGSPAGTLGGTLTVNAVAGVATFSNLTIDATGSGFMLDASATGLTGATSDTFSVTPPTFGLTQNMADRFGGDVGCSANDVQITQMSVTGITSCIGGEIVIVDLSATLDFGSASRYDIGVFISNDGKTPKKLSTNPPPDTGAASCTVAILPTASPFADLDSSQTPGDTCGDGSDSTVGVPVGTTNGVAGPLVIRGATILCQATSGTNGNLFIPFATSWDIQDTRLCTSAAFPVPTTSSKCNTPTTAQATVNVVVLPRVTKTRDITTPTPGVPFTYTVVISNNTGDTLSGAVFKDPDPAEPNLSISAVSCVATTGATCPAINPGSMATGVTLPNMLVNTAQNITAITKANPAVVTYAGADTYANGDKVSITGVSGMTELNNGEFTVANVNAAANTFELSGINSTAYAAYISNGSITEISTLTFLITASSSNPTGTFTNTATVTAPTLICNDGTGNCAGKIAGDVCNDLSGICTTNSPTAPASDTVGGKRVRVIKWREVFR